MTLLIKRNTAQTTRTATLDQKPKLSQTGSFEAAASCQLRLIKTLPRNERIFLIQTCLVIILGFCCLPELFPQTQSHNFQTGIVWKLFFRHGYPKFINCSAKSYLLMLINLGKNNRKSFPIKVPLRD